MALGTFRLHTAQSVMVWGCTASRPEYAQHECRLCDLATSKGCHGCDMAAPDVGLQPRVDGQGVPQRQTAGMRVTWWC